MQIATFVIAVVGLVLSAGSLAWQAATYVLTGGRIKVVLKIGAMTAHGPDMIVGPAKTMTPQKLAELAQQGYPRPVISLEVINIGRMPVTVKRWSLNAALGISLLPVANSVGPDLPHRLDAGESTIWALDLATAVRFKESVKAAEMSGESRRTAVFGVAELGDGRTARSKERF